MCLGMKLFQCATDVRHALQKETSQTLCSARAMLLDDIYVFKNLISDLFLFLIADDVLISDVGLGRFGVMLCAFSE